MRSRNPNYARHKAKPSNFQNILIYYKVYSQHFLIESPTCSGPSEAEIDGFFVNQSLKSLKADCIFQTDKWVFKRVNNFRLTTPDTHLYRLRKADKIRKFIEKNKLEAHIAVPKKYIYWNKTEEKFYVVAEKVELSEEVATLADKNIEAAYKGGTNSEGQIRALAEDKAKRSLTIIQAKALAELCISAGYTDLSYNNLYFTQDGKVAIIDTEPVKRVIKKIIRKF